MLAIVFAFHAASAIAQLSNSGTLFYAGFMQNYGGSSDRYLELSIASDLITTGTVSSNAGFNQSFSVTPGTVTSVIVPQTHMHMGSETVQELGIKVESVDPITVHALNFEAYTADGTSLLPFPMLGTDHMVLAYAGLSVFPGLLSELLVVATADGTEVEITPTAFTLGGHPAGVPFTVLLNEGQSYQVQAASGDDDLTGTRVRVTNAPDPCTPIAVFSGAVCTNVPTACVACDHLFEQNFPVQAWGMQALAVPFLSTSTYSLRVIARDDGATVTIDGSPLMLNAGQWIDQAGVSLPRCIEADAPIGVAQYMEGVNCANNGDPAMVFLPAQDQGITQATVGAISSPVITDQYLNIVTEAANAGSIELNGAPIPALNYLPFPNCTSWVYHTGPLPPGSSVIEAPLPFRATVYGLGSAESYASSLGAILPQVIYEGDTTICWDGDSITLTAPPELVDPWWALAGAPEDTLATDSVYTFMPVDQQVMVVHDGSGVDACFGLGYAYTIELLQPITLTALAPDSACAFTEVDLEAVASPLLPGLSYAWTSSAALTDPFAAITSATFFGSGWVSVTVQSIEGCNTEVDSAFVAVVPNALMGVDATALDSSTCPGGTTQLIANIQQAIASDDLDGGLGALWSAVQGGQVGTSCGAGPDAALVFDGAPPRRATTQTMDVQSGGEIRFELMVSNGSVCDNADPGDDIELLYSTTGGAIWYWIATFDEAGFPVFTPLSITLPPAALSANTQFRWQQVGSFAPGDDVWALDNVVISREQWTGTEILWTPASSLNDPTIPDPMATPTDTTVYAITVTDDVSGCVVTGSVTVNVGGPLTVDAWAPAQICYPMWVSIQAFASDTVGTTYDWDEVGSTGCTIFDPYSPNASLNCVPGSYLIAVSITSGDSCTASDTVAVEVVPGTPLPVIVQSGNHLIVPDVYSSYQWYFNGVAIPAGITDSLLIGAVNGVYSVWVIDMNGCMNISEGYPIWTSIEEPGSEELTVAFDPVSSSITVTSPSGIDEVRVHTTIGQLIAHEHGRSAARFSIPVPAQAIYLVKVVIEGRAHAARVAAF